MFVSSNGNSYSVTIARVALRCRPVTVIASSNNRPFSVRSAITYRSRIRATYSRRA